jgi:hypothetical protein
VLLGLVLLVLLVNLNLALLSLVVGLALHLLQILDLLVEVLDLPVQRLALLPQLLVKPLLVRIRGVQLPDQPLLLVHLLLFESQLLFQLLQRLLLLLD